MKIKITDEQIAYIVCEDLKQALKDYKAVGDNDIDTVVALERVIEYYSVPTKRTEKMNSPWEDCKWTDT